MTHTQHSTPMVTLLCCPPKIIYKQPPAAVPPGHCTPHHLVGRAGTHVSKAYILLQNAKKTSKGCHVATKLRNIPNVTAPVLDCMHQPAYQQNIAKPMFNRVSKNEKNQKNIFIEHKTFPKFQYQRQTHYVISRQHGWEEQKCGLQKAFFKSDSVLKKTHLIMYTAPSLLALGLRKLY